MKLALWLGALLAVAGCGPLDAQVVTDEGGAVAGAEEDSAIELALEQELTSDPGTPLPPYPWPLAPFDGQHPVRGFLNDPRCPGGYDGTPVSFHFGIDVAGADGTPVYAVEAGTVVVQAAQVIAVVSDNGRRIFSYWHILHDAVKGRQHVAKGQQVGTIAKGWGHVHLAEVRAGAYLNPLRRGGITPFFDYGAPKVRALVARRGEQPVQLAALKGTLDLVVDAQDVTPVPVADPQWANKPVAPALVRFRLLRGTTVLEPWTVAADLRAAKLAATRFKQVYAPGTDQNHPEDPGRYWFWLKRAWNTVALANGSYTLEVEASDIRENASTRSFALTIAN